MNMQADVMQAQRLAQSQAVNTMAAKAYGAGQQNLSQMRNVAQEFEAFFLSQMLQPMFQNLGAEEPFGGGPGEDIWRQMQVDEFGKAMSRSGGVGIADMIMREMIKMQEVPQ